VDAGSIWPAVRLRSCKNPSRHMFLTLADYIQRQVPCT
jgi:hypothetical protein